MIEIGTTKSVKVRRRDKNTGKLTPVLDEQGQPMIRLLASEVVRATKGRLDGHFGRDHGRKLVIKLAAGDLLVLWPQGTRQKTSIELSKVYAYVLHLKAMRLHAEKMREQKIRKTAIRNNRRQQYAEKKLFLPAIRHNPTKTS